MKMEMIAVIGGASLFIAGGLFFIFLGSRNLCRAFASTGWPVVTGVVIESETSEDTTRDTSTNTSSKIVSAKIVTRYQANGRDYTTETLHFGQTMGSGDSSEAELRRLRYPQGARVSVSYDPGDPSIAALTPGFHPDVLWLLGAGLGFALPGVMFIFFYFGTKDDFMAKAPFVIGLSLFSTIFALIGMALLTPGLINLWRAQASTKWPAVPGRLVYAQQDSSTSVSRDNDGQSYRGTAYGAHVIFSYEVAGRTYFSNQRRYGQLAGSDAEWAAKIAEKYPRGKEVTVTYNPQNPNQAVLEPGFDPEALWLPGAGAAFFLFGLAVFFFGIPALTRDV